MKRINICYYRTGFGELLLGSFQGKLCLCDWRYRAMRETIDKRLRNGLDAAYHEIEDDVIVQAKGQLEEYFQRKRKVFDILLLMVGTDFQKAVWRELLNIPYGATGTYKGLATRLNVPAAIRAVASANGANAISIFVPCHRIIGSSGELVGYAGGLPAKRRLLALEGDLQSEQYVMFDA